MSAKSDNIVVYLGECCIDVIDADINNVKLSRLVPAACVLPYYWQAAEIV